MGCHLQDGDEDDNNAPIKLSEGPILRDPNRAVDSHTRSSAALMRGKFETVCSPERTCMS